MSWTHLSDTNPKARKDHFCELCERIILKGTVHVARRGIGDGGALHNKNAHSLRDCVAGV